MRYLRSYAIALIYLGVGASAVNVQPTGILRPYLTIKSTRATAECEIEAVLANAIARVEGWFAGSGTLVRRLNNPGALVFAGQPGARDDPVGYAAFETEAAGWEALRRDLRAKRAAGRDVRAIAEVWAVDGDGYYEALLAADERLVGLVSSPACRFFQSSKPSAAAQ